MMNDDNTPTTTAGPETERKWYYSSKLCTSDVKEYFPFPLILEPKSWNVKQGEYVVPDDVMSSMYTELKVHQRNKLKIRMSRKLQLDYHQKEFVLYASDDSVVVRTAGTNIIRTDVTSGDPTGISLVIRGATDPVVFYCDSNDERAHAMKEIAHFCDIIKRDAAHADIQTKSSAKE